MKNQVICFIGTDGAGKSTLIFETKKELEKNGLKVKTIYFGWKPFLPTTKLLSFILKKRNYQIADKMNSKNTSTNLKNKVSLFQEFMLSYYYIEYLSRYIFQLKLPLLFTKKKLALVDRYFYDMYAHYRYADQSHIFPFLLKIMPKPNLTIFLDVDIQVAQQRKPEMDLTLLKEHHQRYQQLSKLINAKTVRTNQNLEQSLEQVLELINHENRLLRA